MTRRMLIPLAVAAAFALTGCGGEEEDEGGTAASGPTQTVEVHEKEFALDPSTVTLDAAGTYTFRAINDGSFEHALEIEGNGVEDETETLAAGESGEVTVELQEGTYELYCPIANHRQQGMVGRVVVGAGGAGAGTTTTNGETETDDNSGSGEGYGY